MGIIFGPVISRRFGKSLGIDLSPNKKQCNYDCIYCELKPAKQIDKYSDIVPPEKIIQECKDALDIYKDIDVVTVTANGEPTLYPYLYEIAKGIKALQTSSKLLILSNGSTITDNDTIKALEVFDIVKLSFDCATQRCFKRIDRAKSGISIDDIKEGMLKFRKNFSNTLIIEVLIVENINDKKDEIEKIDQFLLKLNPDRVDLSTIDRPPAYDVKPLSYKKLFELSQIFDPSLHIHIASRQNISSIEKESYTKERILDTLAKRPLTDRDIELLMDKASIEVLKELLIEGKVEKIEKFGIFFYILSKNS